MWQTISHALHIYGYPFITGLVVVECSGLIVPGETVLLAASVAAAHGHLNIWLVILAASIGAIIGITEIVFGAFLGVILFNETLAPLIILGSGFILVAAALPSIIELRSKRLKPA